MNQNIILLLLNKNVKTIEQVLWFAHVKCILFVCLFVCYFLSWVFNHHQILNKIYERKHEGKGKLTAKFNY